MKKKIGYALIICPFVAIAVIAINVMYNDIGFLGTMLVLGAGAMVAVGSALTGWPD